MTSSHRGSLIGLAALLAAVIIGGASAPVTATKPEGHKVTICHATAAFDQNGNRKYTRNTVDIASSGYVKGGHHKPPANLGKKHKHGGDIIPPYTYGDFDYPGQNWTAKGQRIWENGCRVPVPEKPKRLYDADGYVCGDPRVVFWLENYGDVPVVARIRFVAGREDIRGDVIRTPWRTIKPGEAKLWKRWAASGTVAWLYVKGDGRAVKLTVREGGPDWYGRCPSRLVVPFGG